MALFNRKPKVKAKHGGRVVSIRRGTRIRVAIEKPDGEAEYLFVSSAKVREGQRLSPNATVGSL